MNAGLLEKTLASWEGGRIFLFKFVFITIFFY